MRQHNVGMDTNTKNDVCKSTGEAKGGGPEGRSHEAIGEDHLRLSRLGIWNLRKRTKGEGKEG